MFHCKASLGEDEGPSLVERCLSSEQRPLQLTEVLYVRSQAGHAGYTHPETTVPALQAFRSSEC